jgi:hypothetical protein
LETNCFVQDGTLLMAILFKLKEYLEFGENESSVQIYKDKY